MRSISKSRRAVSESTAIDRQILVDTNIVSAHFKADPAATPKLESCERIYLPLVVLGELLFGAHKSPHPERNLQRVRRFQEAATLLLPDGGTAAIYGRVKANQSVAGTPIPENDLWI